MLTYITSLADYFNKVKQEKSYQKAVTRAYKYNYGKAASYKKSIAWINDWSKNNVKGDRTCFAMSDFLNRFITELNEKEKLLIERRAARTGVTAAVVNDETLLTPPTLITLT